MQKDSYRLIILHYIPSILIEDQVLMNLDDEEQKLFNRGLYSFIYTPESL